MDAAASYLARAGQPARSSTSTSLIMAGHQPELFHPGVWVKNFAIAGLAANDGSTAVHLIADHDTVKSSLLHLPVVVPGQPDQTRLASLPFDKWEGEVPYEDRTVHNEDVFLSVPEHAAALMHNWGFEPFLDSFWQAVKAQAARTSLLGERFVAARRAFERSWGCHNLEVPVSHACRTEAFAWFACHVLLNLASFHAAHNQCLAEHRHKNGIRSRNHPVADLTVESEWHELPFWAWRAVEPTRRRLFVRKSPAGFELRSGRESWPTLPVPETGRETELVRAWQQLERNGFKVRSRALTNTLFARWFVADLFVHGIGGGKYDELTDAIARRFYGVEPPGYLVLSATLLLPLPTYSQRPKDCCDLKRRLRDLHFNPDRHLSQPDANRPDIQRLLQEKRSLIDRESADKSGRRSRFEAFRALNAKLRPLILEQSSQIDSRLGRCRSEVESNRIVQRRDYAFCFFPEVMLRRFCTSFLSERA
jgi:hypothetical protein